MTVPQFGSQAQQVDAINRQARELIYQDPDQAAKLFEQASILAQTGEFSDRPYKEGLATSLAALASIHMETKPDLATQCCLQVLTLLDGYPIIPPLVEAKTFLGWIYLHLGDYSASMDWALQALHHSQERALSNHEGAALDLIANIHSTLGEFTQALQSHEASLKIARANHNQLQEAKHMNNMAMTQMAMGSYEAALTTSRKCLQIFQQLNSSLDMANCYDTLAQILLGMGDYQQAETNLRSGLQIIKSNPNQLLHTYLHKSLGRVYQAQGELSKATAQIEYALANAGESGLKGELAECHHLLAAIHEQRSDYPTALSHFKQFHEINVEIAGDTAQKRLSILNVIHAVENAKHEAEIYRLRNIELQTEIDQRKRIQVTLEELATLDPLTSLYNRRFFMEKSEYEFKRAKRYRHVMAVVMLDVDHFKVINDTYGHAVGDHALIMIAERLKEYVRNIDIVGRIGGEEFSLVLPETALPGAMEVAERLCKSFSEEPLSLPDHSIRVTVSVGVACYFPGEANPSANLDALLQQADQALYRAKNAGRNQVQLFSLNPQA